MAISGIEKRIKAAKTALNAKADLLKHKLQLKRLGANDFKAERLELIQQADGQLAELDPKDKADKKKITALNKDKQALAAQITRTDVTLTEIGGQLSEEETRRLILKKIYDSARTELDRYLTAEKRALVQAVENLWDKYALSDRKLEAARTETLGALNDFLCGLRYFA